MKPTAVLLTVILLVGGISCITKDKVETSIPDDNVLAEIPVKEEKAELPPPPPDSIERPLPMMVKSEPVKSAIGIRESVHTIGCDLIPHQIEEDSSQILTKVEIEAEYPGGAAAWQRFLNRNLRYPQEAIDNEITGSVVVQFVVDKEGNVSDVEAVSGPEVLCAEMIRVIKKSGKWTPAVQGGRYVKSLKKQPFCIHLEAEE
jgi:protein TonB